MPFKIYNVAFDSFGVKSSCVQVKTSNVTITIDPGIAIETDSFPLSLRERSWLVAKYLAKIRASSRNSDIIIITHYHYDHHLPDKDLIYKNKTLLVKHPTKNINNSQKERAEYFLSNNKKLAKKVEFADSKEFRFGNTLIKFSKPLWHGTRNSKLGKVLSVSIEDKKSKKKLLYSSDVDGPILNDFVKIAVEEQPDKIFLDGFPTYLLGFIASYKNLIKSIKNTIKILENTDADIILDHHLLRDYRYRELYWPAYKRARELKRRLLSAAEEEGREPAVISAFKKNGPTRWKNWKKMSID